MKALGTLLTLVVGFAVFPKAIAAEEPKRERGERVRERISESMADLDLTDEQEAKLAEIRKECRPKVQEAARELAALVKDEMKEIHAVLTPQQIEKRDANKDERKERRLEGLAERIAHLKDLDLTDAELAQIEEIREQFRPQHEKLMNDLASVLTDEQREARMEALKSGESRQEVRESLDLTEEQRHKIGAIGKELLGVARQKLEKINSVLTSDQKEKLGELRDERRERVRDRRAFAVANAQELGLTDEQKTKIAGIRKAFRPRIHEAGDKLRSDVRDELAQILVVVKQ